MLLLQCFKVVGIICIFVGISGLVKGLCKKVLKKDI